MSETVPVDEVTLHFGPFVAAAGLVLWRVGGVYPKLWVGTKPELGGSYRMTPVDPAWAFGSEAFSFELIARRMAADAVSSPL